jgi:hypothetical protein
MITSATPGGALIENAWIPYQTEEIPKRAFHKWYMQQHSAQSSQKEVKGQYPRIEERI